jgi:regulator of sirC expression with transglutaminase-like and TPR domain
MTTYDEVGEFDAEKFEALFAEREAAVDLRLVRDVEAWRAFVRSQESELRALARTPEDAELLIRRMLGR